MKVKSIPGMGRLRGTLHSNGLATCLSALMAVSVPLAADEGKGKSGIPEIRVDLKAVKLEGVLPFDLPFQVHGDLPTDAKGLRIGYRGFTGSEFVANKDWIEAEEIDIDGSGSMVEKCHWDTLRIDAASWKRSSVSIGLPDANGARKFRGFFPRFEANHYYQFCFAWKTPIDEQVRTKVKTAWRATLEGDLRDQQDDLSRGDYRALQTELRQTAQRVIGDLGLETTTEPGSFLDASMTDRALVLEFASAVTPAMTELDRLDLKAREYGAEAATVTPLLLELQDDALATFADDLEAKLTEAQKGRYEPGLTLVREGTIEAGRRALGQAPTTGDDADLTQASTAAEARAFATHYLETRKAVLLLSELVQRRARFGASLKPAVEAQVAALITAGGTLEQLADRLFRLQGIANEVARAHEALSVILDRVSDGLELKLTSGGLIVEGDTVGDFTTNKKKYISADAGFVWAWDIDELVPYVGTNVYFRPVNRAAPLKSLGTFGQTFSRRASLTIALTLSSIQQNGVRDDLFGNESLMLGGGLRVTDTICLNLGALVFKEKDPNPLIQGESVAVTPYFAVSFDWDIVRTFKGIGSKFGGGG